MKNLVRFRPIYPTVDDLIQAAKERAPRHRTREERLIDAKGEPSLGGLDRLKSLIPAVFNRE